MGIDSVNPGLVPGAAGEAAIVEHLRNRLQSNGFTTHVVTAAGHDDRPSLVAIGPPTTPGPTVVLTGHLDTVGVEGMSDPFTADRRGDRLSGRGASDMKGGRRGDGRRRRGALRGAGAPGRVVLALVADEEDASLGAEAVLAALPRLGVRPDVAVVGEPTWLAITESLRGYALVEVVLTGRAAHSSQPELGVNAVAHLGRLLVALEQRDAELGAGGASLMATVASGGDSPFVLARSARALVERRTVPGERSDAAVTEVEQLLADLRASDDTVDGAARLLVAREPWRLDAARPGRLAVGRPRNGAGRHCRRTACAATLPRALLDGGAAVASGRHPGPGLRARRGWAARGRRVGRPRAGTAVCRRPHHGGRELGGRACPLTHDGCGTTRRCSTPGCASRSRRPRRSPSPGTSTGATSSVTSWPGTCRSTPASTR